MTTTKSTTTTTPCPHPSANPTATTGTVLAVLRSHLLSLVFSRRAHPMVITGIAPVVLQSRQRHLLRRQLRRGRVVVRRRLQGHQRPRRHPVQQRGWELVRLRFWERWVRGYCRSGTGKEPHAVAGLRIGVVKCVHVVCKA
jgi:hypothetical protein